MKYLSHIITGVISFILTIYISIPAFGLFQHGFYLDELVFLLVILVPIYLILFYPIDFIIKNIEHIKNGDFSYEIRDYMEDNQIGIGEGHNSCWMHRGVVYYLYFIIILLIINVIIVLPMKGIVYLIRKK